MTFEEELESLKGKETIEEVSAYKIGLYLKRRAAEDPSVASNIAKANKTLTECYRYVKREIGKMVKSIWDSASWASARMATTRWI